MTQEISPMTTLKDVVAELYEARAEVRELVQLAEADRAKTSAAFSEVLDDLKKALDFANRFRKQRNAHALLNVVAIAILIWHWVS